MKNDEKIFLNFKFFSCAGVINMHEKHNKTMSDVKKVNENQLFITKKKWIQNQNLSKDGAYSN
jgi:hypothetical protein